MSANLRSTNYASLIDEGLLARRLQVQSWSHTPGDHILRELQDLVIRGLEFPIGSLSNGLWTNCLPRTDEFAFRHMATGDKYIFLAPALKQAARYGHARSLCLTHASKARELENLPRSGTIIGGAAATLLYAVLVTLMYATDLLLGPYWVWDGFFGVATWAKLLLFGLGACALLFAPVVLLIRRMKIASAHNRALLAWSNAEHLGVSALKMLGKCEGLHPTQDPIATSDAGNTSGAKRSTAGN